MLWKKKKPIAVEGLSIRIDGGGILTLPTELRAVLKLVGPTPLIRVYEEDELIMEYAISPLKENPDLTGQYLQTSVRILESHAVMVDGLITKRNHAATHRRGLSAEGVRFQPFFLKQAAASNTALHGKGLFDRGLHYSGTITPSSVRLCCVCDICRKSFSIHSYHAGFSGCQYFYSGDSSKTLFVPYYKSKNMPEQLEINIDLEVIQNVEKELPLPSNGSGPYKYYNSFRCPYCKAPYIDFEKYPGIRSKEYYGNVYINEMTERYE